MNRRGFFGLLAAVALLPKKAVGKMMVGSAKRAGWNVPRPVHVVEEDIFGKTRLCESRWQDGVVRPRLPARFRVAVGRKVRSTVCLPQGRFRHVCRWTEQVS